MIFIIHYICLNAGLPAITILLTVFLSKYSDGSPAEIGTLLMVLPLLSTFMKPVFCALADRQRAHKQYLLVFLFLMLIGYGSFVIIPFTDLYILHARTSWYVLVLLSVVGYLAWSVVWSLGDSLCVNWSIRSGTNFGAIRKFGTMSWGVFGLLIGQINEIPGFPIYVPGFLVFVIATLLELIIVAFWNNDAFAMVATSNEPKNQIQLTQNLNAKPQIKSQAIQEKQTLEQNKLEHPKLTNCFSTPVGVKGTQFCSLKGVPSVRDSINANNVGQGVDIDVNATNSLRMNVRIAGAVANILIEDIGSSISSTLRSKRHQRPRVGAGDDDDIFKQFGNLSPQTTLSKATAAAALDTASIKANFELQQQLTDNKKSHNNNSSLQQQVVQKKFDIEAAQQQQDVKAGSGAKEDLQLALFKLIVSTKAGFFKYIVLFGIFGVMFSIHITFFFMHVEELCTKKGYNFSRVTSVMFVSQSISETTFFVLAPVLIRKLGRAGAVSCCMLLFAVRYAFYGFFYELVDPYYALAFETCHGFAYGIAYSLVTDVALDFANEASQLIPQLMAKGLIEPSVDLIALELSLRATFQGCYSGIFDGLGWGLGSLVAGVYLNNHSFKELWILCAAFSLVTAVLNQLNQLRASLCNSSTLTTTTATATTTSKSKSKSNSTTQLELAQTAA